MDQEDDQGDIVTAQWIKQHNITIPKAPGIHQSSTGWVKIDRTGTVVAAGEMDQTVLAWLVTKKTLSNADVDYAIAYVTYRNADRAYRRQMGFKCGLDISILGEGTGFSCEQAAKAFSLVRKQLGRENDEIIRYACDTIRTPDLPTNYKPDYRRAFTALANAFDKAIKDVREGNVSDEPQSGIEKILARVAKPC